MESSCNIQLKVMYAKDLKAFSFFQKLNVYALVSIVSHDPNKKLVQNKQQRTPADKEGDGNPEWKYEMRFDLSEASFQDSDHLFIQFELRHEGLMFGDKTIGEVRVPFKDLIEASNGVVRFVSYEVRTPNGKPNGVLNFSFKVNGNGTNIGTNSAASEITGYSLVPEIQYPSSVTPSGTQEIHYPSLEWLDTHQDATSAPQEVHCLSPRAQYSSQENYYYPPHAYYQRPPPPPPPAFPHPLVPPPQPPTAHGACYHPPYGYAMYRTQGPLQKIRSFANKIYDELGEPVEKLFVSGSTTTAFSTAFGHHK